MEERMDSLEGFGELKEEMAKLTESIQTKICEKIQTEARDTVKQKLEVRHASRCYLDSARLGYLCGNRQHFVLGHSCTIAALYSPLSPPAALACPDNAAPSCTKPQHGSQQPGRTYSPSK
ncbi:hypothetical protein Pcinc_036221 [Petrolisthes cinctipes]|uniref:Uncharacterized protein n=1 Tax=Petrolisthes cinctipes TaxID=88211 RepID=A0AAE1BUV1_PETCI|nr:hypothetical protein Pcinc_036221 [Petrolisthes cinctipes]